MTDWGMMTVLVVASENEVSYVADLVLALGYRIGQVASNISEAQDLLKTQDPDFVVVGSSILKELENIDGVTQKEQLNLSKPVLVVKKPSVIEQDAANSELVLEQFQQAVQESIEDYAICVGSFSEGQAIFVGDRFYVLKEGSIKKISLPFISHIEFIGSICRIWFEKESYRCRISLARLYEKLPDSLFISSDLHCLVNTNFIDGIVPSQRSIQLHNGHSISFGIGYARRLKTQFPVLA